MLSGSPRVHAITKFQIALRRRQMSMQQLSKRGNQRSVEYLVASLMSLLLHSAAAHTWMPRNRAIGPELVAAPPLVPHSGLQCQRCTIHLQGEGAAWRSRMAWRTPQQWQWVAAGQRRAARAVCQLMRWLHLNVKGPDLLCSRHHLTSNLQSCAWRGRKPLAPLQTTCSKSHRPLHATNPVRLLREGTEFFSNGKTRACR